MHHYITGWNSERFILDPEILNNDDHEEICIFVRMEILSNNLDKTGFTSGLGSKDNQLMGINFKNNFIYLTHQLVTDPVNVGLSFKSVFHLSDNSNTQSRECSHSSVLNNYYDFGMSYLKIVIHKRYQDGKIGVLVSSDMPCLELNLELVVNMTWEEVKKFYFGSKKETKNEKSPFLYIFYDLQIFESSVFLTDDLTDIVAFTKDGLHSVYCAQNKFLLRQYNAQKELDDFYQASDFENLHCSKRTSNIGCITKCALCAGDICLLCEEYHQLIDNNCINKFVEAQNLDYIVSFNRDISNDIEGTGDNKIAFIYLEIDHSTLTDSQKKSRNLVVVNTNTVGKILFPEYSENSLVRQRLGTTNTTDFQAALSFTTPEITVLNIKVKNITPKIFNYKIFTVDIAAFQDYQSLYNSYAFKLEYKDLAIDLSEQTYMQSNRKKLDVYSYQDTQSTFYSTIKIYSKCSNNCQCLKNQCLQNPNNVICEEKQYLLSSKLRGAQVDHCIACEDDCATCNGSLCTSCKQTEFNQFSITDFKGKISEFKSCQPCEDFSSGCLKNETYHCLVEIDNLRENGFYFEKFVSGFQICQFGKCLPNCLTCVDGLNCLSCESGYDNSTVDKVCSKILKNCSQSKAGICIACEVEYALRSNSSCGKCSSNCLKCEFSNDNTSICVQCGNGSSLVNERCVVIVVNIQVEKLNSNSSAKTIIKNENERRCKEGFFFSSSAFLYLKDSLNCQRCPNNPLTCKKTKPNNDYIIEKCHQKFIGINRKLNKCINKVDHCSQYNDSTFECKQCKPDYFLINTEQHTKTCSKCIIGCAICVNFKGCLHCGPSYFVNDSKECSSCSENCLLCADSKNCLKCKTGYNLFLKGKKICLIFFSYTMRSLISFDKFKRLQRKLRQ